MAIKSDKWIKRMALERGMIAPFAENQVREGVISYGLSSYGYDFRLANEFKLFRGSLPDLIDPKRPDATLFSDHTGEQCTIPPNCFALGRSLEYFKIPRRVLALCTGKSTYARCGLIVNVTPLEPEWEGYITVSIANTAPAPVRVYANEGVGQVVFFEADEDCLVSYRDRGGKYQAQPGIWLPRL